MPDFTEAISFAQAHEVPWPRDPQADPARWGVHHEDPPPFDRLRGPVHPRGGVSGVIRWHGEEVARWGEPDRADQTFSVAKSWLTWLNREGQIFADASRGSFFLVGAGGHYTWVDPDNALVVVVRWLDTTHSAEFVSRVMRAL